MLVQTVCFHFYCLLHLLSGLLDADRLILAMELIQAGRDGQKSLCFICDKMVPKDSSKRRMHIGKHILKALRKVSETPVPVNNVIFFYFGFLVRSNMDYRSVLFRAVHAGNQHQAERAL